MRGRVKTVICGAAAAVLAATGGAWATLSPSSRASAASAASTGLATVVQTDLVAQQAIPGTVGYDAPFTLYGPSGTAAQAVTQARQALATDRATVAADGTALGDTTTGNDQSVQQQQGALHDAQAVAGADQGQAQQDQRQQTADQHALDASTIKQQADQAQLTTDTSSQRALQTAQLTDQQQQAAAQAQLATDQANLATANQALSTDQHSEQAGTQALAAALASEQADRQAAASDCSANANAAQCAADQARVTRDSQLVSTYQQQVASDQAVVTRDQAAVSSAGSTVGTDQASLTGLQQRLNTDASTLQHDGFAVADDQAALQQDSTDVGTYRAAVSADQAKVQADATRTSLSDPAAVHAAQAALAGAQVSATRALHQAQAKVVADALELQDAQAALATAERTQTGAGTTFTWLPPVGHVITQGQPVYALDGEPVPLLYGQVPLFRELRAGVADGPDVVELNSDLGLVPSAQFTAATTGALQRWQSAHGLPATGVLELGQVVMEPGPFRVTALHATLGGTLGTGAVLDATSPTLVVTAQVPVTDLGSVAAGDAVTVDLPDGRNGIAGRVRDIGASVTAPSIGNNAQNGSSSPGAASVPATVTLADPTVARGLDQAAVLVHVTTQTVRGVLAVPIEALLALSGGGEGVEVVSGGLRHIVPVTTGLFTGTQVQVEGPGVTAGAQVVVPAP